MFITGIRGYDRVRGAGWLDCPNCHEHAAQDVVDEMGFVAFLFYRFAPVRRRRVLVCRKCGFRRPAVADELRHLETSGRPIHRAWLVPLGLGPFIAGGIVALLVARASGGVAVAGVTFGPQSADPIAPVTFSGPVGWNYEGAPDATPPRFTVSDPSQRIRIVLRRIPGDESLDHLLNTHWLDEAGLNTTGFPESPCKPTEVKLGGLKALRSEGTYLQQGDAARQVLFVVVHDHVGYSLTYLGLGQTVTKELDGIITNVNDSLKFGPEPQPTPIPSQSASPGTASSPGASPSPGASASASPSPSAGASPSASASGSPTPVAGGCS